MTLISIIGLPRSGTTLLGRTLAATPGAHYLEEPNPIWRFQNWRSLGHEEFSAKHATEPVRRYIRNFLFPEDAGLVIEKTPANCLRTGFVEAVAPEARLIFITRDSDAIKSSMLRKWIEGADGNAARLNDDVKLRELRGKFAKFHYVHPREMPLYIFSELAARWSLARRGHTDFWGPQFEGWQALQGCPPEEVVSRAHDHMEARLQEGIQRCTLPHSVISYESLIAAPEAALSRAMQELDCPDIDISASVAAFYRGK